MTPPQRDEVEKGHPVTYLPRGGGDPEVLDPSRPSVAIRVLV